MTSPDTATNRPSGPDDPVPGGTTPTSGEPGDGSGGRSSGGGLFYGWIIVASVFLVLMVSSGLGFYNASVILSAATDELDVSVGAVSGATALFFAVSGLTGFVLSRQMDSRDIRVVYLAGGLVGAISLLGLHWVDSVGLLYVFFALFGMGFALSGLVPGTTLVTRWFEARRSVALSVASTGLSIGGIVLTPVAAWLIDRRTLSGAGPIMAVMWLVGIIPIGLLLLRSRPADKGLLPDGASTPHRADGTGEHTVPLPGATFAQATRTRFFAMLCAAYALIFFAQVGGLAHLFNAVAERTDKATAGTALSLLAGASVIGRLIGGVVVLRVPTRTLSLILSLVQGFSLIALANAFSIPGILASAAVLGVSVGNLLMLQPLILAEAFGVAAYSRIYSLNQLASTVGVAAGPATLGLIHDQADYRASFLVAGLAGIVGFVSFVAAGSVARARSSWVQGPGPTGPAPTAAAPDPAA